MQETREKSNKTQTGFNPCEYEIKEKIYGNTGGGCMVGTLKFYLPITKNYVWVNCTEDGASIYSANVIWEPDEDESADETDTLIMAVDFREMIPDSDSLWTPLIKETLAYTIEQMVNDGEEFDLPAAWLPGSN